MKSGDLVRHRFDGQWDDVGIILNIKRGRAHPTLGLVKVLWGDNLTQRNNKVYRIRDLEVVSVGS